jgi:hypothetical protein
MMKLKLLSLLFFFFLFNACASSSSIVRKDVAVNAILVPLEQEDSSVGDYTVVSNGVFSEVWESYLKNSFNTESQQSLTLEVALLSVEINELVSRVYENVNNPGDRRLQSGAAEPTDVTVELQVNAEYQGRTFNQAFEVKATKKKQTQTSGYGATPSDYDTMDPEQMRRELIKEALEKSVIEVDKALNDFYLFYIIK